MRCQIQFFNQWCEYKKKSVHVWCEKAGGPIYFFIYFYLSCRLLKTQNHTLFMKKSTMNVTIFDPIFEHKTPELICHMLWSVWAMDITFIRLLLGPKSQYNANTEPDKTCLLIWSLVQFLTTDTWENTKRKAVSAAVTDHCTSNMQSQSDAKDKLTDRAETRHFGGLIFTLFWDWLNMGHITGSDTHIGSDVKLKIK